MGNSGNSSGAGSTNIAIGTVSRADGNGTANIAIGTFSYARGGQNVALGYAAAAGGIGNTFDPINRPTNNLSNTGAVALGNDAQAGATAAGQNNATAIGDSTRADVANGTAVGQGAVLGRGSDNSTAVGQGSTVNAFNQNSTAIGRGATAGIAGQTQAPNGFTTNATALGDGAQATARFSTALGASATASGSASLALGPNSTASNTDSIAIGQLTTASGNVSTVLGEGSSDNGVANSLVLGQDAHVTAGVGGTNVALGQGTTAARGSQTNYTAAFLTQPQTSAGEVAIGAAAGNRQITGVAPGSQGTDAVNLDQLQAGLASVGTASVPFAANGVNGTLAPSATGADAVAGGYGATATQSQTTALGNRATASGQNATALGYNTKATANNSVALGQGSLADTAYTVSVGSNGSNNIPAFTRRIVNVAAGTAATDAVNLGQLQAVGNNLATALGGNAGFSTATGTFTAPTYTLNNGTVTARDVGTALTNLDGRTTTNTNDIAALQNGTAGTPFTSYQFSGEARPTASGVEALAGGFGAIANGNYSTALGNSSGTNGFGASAFGAAARATVQYATALGEAAQANLVGSVALGQGAATTAASDTSGNAALGIVNNAGAVTAGSGNVVSIGGGVIPTRQIQKVAAGAVTADSTDAVNGSQLFSVASNVNAVGAGAAAGIGGGAAYNVATGTFTAPSYALNGSTLNYTSAVQGIAALANGSAGPVQYATPGTPSNSLALVGTGGTVTLGNVAAGTLAAGSTQAVNGGQLFATNTNLATTNQRAAAVFGGGAGVDANGVLTAPSYAVQGGSYNSVGGALGALDTATTGNSQAIGVLQGQTAANMQGIAANSASIVTLQSGQSGPFRGNNTSGYAEPVASGNDAVAGGFGSVASGQLGTAIGTGAQATRAGAVAIGAFAQATADPTTAVGFAANATGNEASAFGAFATASGDNSTALGRSASAAGGNSVAVGAGAGAGQANSVAIGLGVQTSRANQVAIGNAGQTYTLAGLTSAQSLAAQTGATGFVTTDTNGNLAASGYGPAQIAQMDGRINSLAAGLLAANRYALEARREARGGVAMSIATAQIRYDDRPGKLSLGAGIGSFKGEGGFGGGVGYTSLDQRWRVNAAVSTSTRGDVGAGGGLTITLN